MIHYIRGVVKQADEPHHILVEPSGLGLGFEVRVSEKLRQTVAAQSSVELYLIPHLRTEGRSGEAGLEYFGFESRGSRALFLLLTSVSGVGARTALQILDFFEPLQLVDLLMRRDARALSQAPGLGKKTSERLVLELAEKMEDFSLKWNFRNHSRATSSAVGSTNSSESTRLGGGTTQSLSPRLRGLPSAWMDAESALLALGFKAFDVSAALEELLMDLPQDAGAIEALNSSILIRRALQKLQTVRTHDEGVRL